MRQIAVVIPSYNEEPSIGWLVGQIRKSGLRVVVVDDGSKDKTAIIAEQQGAQVIRHRRNQGKGACLKNGLAFLKKEGFEFALMMDGDGQHRPEDIANFLSALEKTDADLIIGNRMHDTAQMPTVRKITNRFMSWLISSICGQNIPDTQCGFRLIRLSLFGQMQLASNNYEIESEMLILASRLKAKIASIKIATIYQDELSRIHPLIDTWRFLLMLFHKPGRKSRESP
jgi:glycosyltransferase involved in cell wall biosynthesis